MVKVDRPAPGPRCLKDAAQMYPTADHDLSLLAARLKLGLPLRGFDGREIPLRSDSGECLGPIDAAHALLESGAGLLPPAEADVFVADVCERAGLIETAASRAGDSPAVVSARVTAVLVSGAVRASVLARGHDISPSAINRATLAWYQLSDLRWHELQQAEFTAEFSQLSA